MIAETVSEGRALLIEHDGRMLLINREQAAELLELLPELIDDMPIDPTAKPE